MGLFSGSKKITVFSTSSPLIAAPVNKAREAVLYAILKGQPIAATIVDDAIMGGVSMKADRAYKYGYETYSLGLPAGSMSSARQVSNTVVEGILEGVLGQRVSVFSNTVDMLSVDHIVGEFLMNTRGLIPLTGIIQNHSFPINPDYPITFHSTEYVQATHQVLITYKQEYVLSVPDMPDENILEYFTEYHDIPSGLSIGDTYCIADYQLRSASNELIPGRAYWYYRIADGTYPVLNRALIEFDQTGFFPVVPIRRHNVDLTTGASRETALYTTSGKLLKHLGIKIDDLATRLNENPDIADIDHAYVIMGVDIQSQVPESMRYLAMFFDYLSGNSRYSKNAFEASLQAIQPLKVNILSNDYKLQRTPSSITFQELDLSFKLTFNYIESTLVDGSIGPKGTVTSTTQVNPDIVVEREYYSTPGDAEPSLHIARMYINADTITFRWQITEATYRQVLVHGLIHTNDVYAGKTVGTTLEESLDPDDNNFIVPVHYGIAQRLPLLKRNMLYQDALRLQINSYVITKVKWYEHSFFKFLLVAVSIVITVVTSGGAAGWMAGLVGAAEAGVMALAQYVLPQILFGLLINFGMKLVARLIGSQLATLLGAALMVYSLASGPKGNISLGSIGKMPTAQTLLSVGKALIQASQELLGEAFNDLYKEMTQWSEQVATKEAELEKATELLNQNTSLLNPLDWVVSPRFINLPYESPSAFYERTIHTGNPGVKTLDVIGNFHDNMLMLPKPNTLTMG